MYLTRRIAAQHSKMSRFLNAYMPKICKSAMQQRYRAG